MNRLLHLLLMCWLFCGGLYSAALAQPVHPDRTRMRDTKVRSIMLLEHNGWDGGFMTPTRQFTERYDKKGRLQVRIDHTVDMGPKRTVFIYDKNGALKNERKFDEQEHICFQTNYEYAQDGRLMMKITFNGGGGIENRDVYKYDSFGNLKEVASFALDAKLSAVDVFKFDTFNQMTEYAMLEPSGSKVYQSVYTYDKKGKRTSASNFDTRDTTLSAHWQYKYDRKGRLIEEELFNIFGEPVSMSRFKYDRKGNLRDQTQIYMNGQSSTRYQYVYKYYRKRSLG